MKAKQKEEKQTVELSTYSPLWGICEEELAVMIAHYERQITMDDQSLLIHRNAAKSTQAGFYSKMSNAEWLRQRGWLLHLTLRKLYALRDGAKPVQSREVVYAYS